MGNCTHSNTYFGRGCDHNSIHMHLETKVLYLTTKNEGNR